MQRNKLFVFLSIFNFFCVFGILSLAGYFFGTGFVSEKYLISWGFLLTGQQIGQTVGMQVTLKKNKAYSSILMFSVALSFLSWLPCAIYKNEFSLIFSSSLTAICAGVHFGIKSGIVLFERGRTDYQIYLFKRNLMVFLVFLSSMMLGGSEFVAYYIYFATSVFVIFREGRPNNLDGNLLSVLNINNFISFEFFALILGVGASLLYRNDVNLIRIWLAKDDGFESVNYVLIAYSAMISASGYLVTNYFYVYLSKNENAILFLCFKYSKLFLFSILIVFVFSFVFFPFGTWFGVFVFGLVTPFVSALLHFNNKSALVYVAGALLFLLVLMTPWYFNVEIISPVAFFLVYVALILFVLTCVAKWTLNSFEIKSR